MRVLFEDTSKLFAKQVNILRQGRWCQQVAFETIFSLKCVSVGMTPNGYSVFVTSEFVVNLLFHL